MSFKESDTDPSTHEHATVENKECGQKRRHDIADSTTPAVVEGDAED